MITATISGINYEQAKGLLQLLGTDLQLNFEIENKPVYISDLMVEVKQLDEILEIVCAVTGKKIEEVKGDSRETELKWSRMAEIREIRATRAMREYGFIEERDFITDLKQKAHCESYKIAV